MPEIKNQGNKVGWSAKLPNIKIGKLARARSGDPRLGLSQNKDHAKFVAKKQYTIQDLDLLSKELSSKSISDDNKLDIMHQAVAPCPEIIMTIKGKPTKSLLDSRYECTLMNESYFKEHIEHRLLPSSGLYNNSHNLFN